MIDLLHLTRRFRVTALLTLCIVSHGHLAQAHPSNKDFDGGIATHGKVFAEALAKQAQGIYEQANGELIKFAKTVKANRVRRLGWKPLGQNHVRLSQLRRLAEQLDLLGETAGNDYRLRAASLMQTSGDIIDRFRVTEEAQKQLEKVRLEIRKSELARAREVMKLEKMAIEGKWEAAEMELYRYLDQLGVATACLSNVEQIAIYAPFGQVHSAIDSAMHRARIVKAKALFTQRRLDETPDFAGVLREVEAAAASLANFGTVSLDGATITGPEAITKFGERWAEVQVRTIRCRTLDWLLSGSLETYFSATEWSVSPGESQDTSKIIQDFANFNKAMMQSLARLIEADASRVTGPEAVRLYVEYLQAWAPLIRRSANRSLAPVVNPALQALASRAPQFPVEIAAYAQGTNDLLRWRGRVARGLATARIAEFPSIDSLMFEATRSDKVYTGLYPIPEQLPDPHIAALLASVPEVMPRPIEWLQGKPAHALDIVRLRSKGPVAIARYRVRSYANIPAPLDLAAETDALKYDLMVGENLPAISTLAAVAVDSAERGDLAAVGGTITNQYLESVTTRFAALPTAASVITALGTIPREHSDYSPRNQVLMRFDLTPSWAQHDFFFVEFSPPETSTE